MLFGPQQESESSTKHDKVTEECLRKVWQLEAVYVGVMGVDREGRAKLG